MIICVAPTTTTTQAPATTTIAGGKNRPQVCVNACVYACAYVIYHKRHEVADFKV